MATQNDNNGETWHMSGSLHLYPLVAVSAVYLVIGVVGNATVGFVSIVRMRRSVLNNFVMSLALAELVGCMITIPIEITQIINIYSFDYPHLCKFERYLRSFIVFFTSCLLIAIATERYQRIVKPHCKHVTNFQFWITIIGSFLFSSIAAIPEAVIAGTEVLVTEYGTGYKCSTYSSRQYAGTVFPALWACFVVVVYVISTTAIGSIYCVIAVQIWKRGKLMTDRKARPNTPDLTLRRRVHQLRNEYNSENKNNTTVSMSPEGSHNHPRIQIESHEDESDISQWPEVISLRRNRHGVSYNSGRSVSVDALEMDSVNHSTLIKEFTENGRERRKSNEEKSTSNDEKRMSCEEKRLSEASIEEKGISGEGKRLSGEEKRLSGEEKRTSIEEKRTSGEEKRTSKERSSLFAEILSHFQSKAATIPRCAEPQSKSLFQEKRFNQEQDITTDQEKEQDNEDGEQFQLKPLKTRKGSKKACKSENLDRTPHSTQPQQKQTQPVQQQDAGRKLTAVFFDELALTVDNRRRRATFSAYGQDFSCEDLLSPPTVRPCPLSLSPMGSVRSRGGYSRKRTTFIMFIMTLTTVLSLLPHVIVMLYRLQQPSVELRLSPDNSVFFRVAWNSFFISLAAHPYVYGFWNGRFKKALVSLFHDVKKEGRRGFDRIRKSNAGEIK